MSIRTKMILSAVAVFLVGALIIALTARQSYQQALTKDAHDSITSAAVVLDRQEVADTAKLSATLRGLLADPELRRLFLAGDREGLYAAAAPIFSDLKKDFSITHWYFESTEASPSVYLRVHKPEQFGDELKRKTYKAAVASKGYGSGLELGKTAVALRTVHPYYDADGKTVIGYMELGQEIDSFLEEIKTQTGDEAAMLLVKDGMDAKAWADFRKQAGKPDNWSDNETYVLAATTSDEIAENAAEFTDAPEGLSDEGDVVGMFTEGDRSAARGAVPIKDVEGKTIGVVFVEHDTTEAAAALFQERLTTLGVVLGMLLVLLLVMILLMNRLIFRRLDTMIADMEDISTRLAGGDFNVHYEAKGGSDEIGHFETFFGRFIDIVAATLRQLTGDKSA